MIDRFWAQLRLTIKDKVAIAKINNATERPLLAGVKYRGESQY
ncbi:hypothetical protein M2305_001859 [Gluconobacter cerinus]|nr:hypothetical protein [Gluconobacter cerinus]